MVVGRTHTGHRVAGLAGLSTGDGLRDESVPILGPLKKCSARPRPGVRSKNRRKSARLGANPTLFRIMYSRLKARNCPC